MNIPYPGWIEAFAGLPTPLLADACMRLLTLCLMPFAVSGVENISSIDSGGRSTSSANYPCGIGYPSGLGLTPRDPSGLVLAGGTLRYTGPEQLLRLNLLKETPEWRDWAAADEGAAEGVNP